jgi:hypothetical protein
VVVFVVDRMQSARQLGHNAEGVVHTRRTALAVLRALRTVFSRLQKAATIFDRRCLPTNCFISLDYFV